MVAAVPSIDVAREYTSSRLPKDPKTGQQFKPGIHSLSSFEPLGLGVTAYARFLQNMLRFMVVVFLISISSMVHNAYGNALRARYEEVSPQTYLFTFTSIGNASNLTPSYGATEFVISCLLAGYLFWSISAFRRDVKRDMASQVTAADFAVRLSGLPHVAAEYVEEAVRAALERLNCELVSLPHGISPIAVALRQRRLIDTYTRFKKNEQLLSAHTKSLTEFAGAV
jgi:hypothetical protein